jgi:hypothetical protein
MRPIGGRVGIPLIYKSLGLATGGEIGRTQRASGACSYLALFPRMTLSGKPFIPARSWKPFAVIDGSTSRSQIGVVPMAFGKGTVPEFNKKSLKTFIGGSK